MTTDGDRTLGSMIIESLEEHLAYARREGPGRTSVLDTRNVEVTRPPVYDPERIRNIRRSVDLSQRVFANILNVSDDTIKAWEQGLRVPSGSAARLLQIVEESPMMILPKYLRVRDDPVSSNAGFQEWLRHLEQKDSA